MLSNKYKCVYVHIPKVAGQSIERVFIGLHGLTWENRAPLLLRPNDDPALGPPRLAHLSAAEYVSCGYITQKEFDSYFRFSFVRNPWSRLVSVYRYLGLSEDMSFRQFLIEDFAADDLWEPRLFKIPQYDFLFTNDGRQLVDYIGRFENLQTDFDQVCSAIGLPAMKLPHANETGSGRSVLDSVKDRIKRISPIHRKYDEHDHYTGYYDSETRKIFERLYSMDIETFGYTFGS